MVKSTYLNVLKSKYKGENRLLHKISVFWGKHGGLEPPASQVQEKLSVYHSVACR
jgi:hypothetical protein